MEKKHLPEILNETLSSAKRAVEDFEKNSKNILAWLSDAGKITKEESQDLVQECSSLWTANRGKIATRLEDEVKRAQDRVQNLLGNRLDSIKSRVDRLEKRIINIEPKPQG